MWLRANRRFAAPVLLGALVAAVGTGLVVDYSNALSSRRRLERVLNATAVEAARRSEIVSGGLSELFSDAAYSRLADVGEALDITMVSTRADDGALHVRIDGAATIPSHFGTLIGRDGMRVHGRADAVRRPIDVVIAVDLSFSLRRNDGMQAARDALHEFLQYFDDDRDRIGLVVFSTWAEDRAPLAAGFRNAVAEQVSRLEPLTDAATDEGLRAAKAALDRADRGSDAVRAVVLFTDGQPTAFADRFRMPDRNLPRYYEGVIAAYLNGPSYRGLFRQTDGRKIRYFDEDGEPVTADNASYAKSVAPKYLPGRFRVDGDNIRMRAIARAESWATLIRNAGYTVYAIGLGGGNSPYAADIPDPAFLRRLANDAGGVDVHAPQGSAVIAPGADALSAAFVSIAGDLLCAATE